MKKCPKCGTILDDSKKKCYMCGADLSKQVPIFDNLPQNEQLEEPVNIPNNANAELVENKRTENNVEMNTNFYNNNELNSMNFTPNKKKSKLENIFAKKGKLNSKDEKNVEKKKTEKINKKNNKDKKTKKVVDNAPKKLDAQIVEQLPQLKKEQTINWEDNLNTNLSTTVNNTNVNAKTDVTVNTNTSANTTNNNKKENSKNKNNFKFPKIDKNNFRLIFNIGCTIIFVGCIIFAVVLLVNRNSDSKGNNKDSELFGGLYYKIDSSFTLKAKEANRRHYTMGENCSISISYGKTQDKNGFVDNYFENIKNSYEKQEGFTTQKTDLTIKGNQWSEMSVIKLRETGEPDYTRYNYISIVNKDDFYTIMFANTDDNADCSAKYEKLKGSLSFE